MINASEAFVNWGTLNGLNSEQLGRFAEASKLHDKEQGEHPENHKMRGGQIARCWNGCSCSCGFGFDVDSSD